VHLAVRTKGNAHTITNILLFCPSSLLPSASSLACRAGNNIVLTTIMRRKQTSNSEPPTPEMLSRRLVLEMRITLR
jgi:hypothetical protein